MKGLASRSGSLWGTRVSIVDRFVKTECRTFRIALVPHGAFQDLHDKLLSAGAVGARFSNRKWRGA